HAARRPEGDQRRRLQVELGDGTLEELVVLRVRPRPAALDVVHAEVVELLRDTELVVDGERDALELRAVAQRRVVDLDGVGQAYARLAAATRTHARPSPCTCRPHPARLARTRRRWPSSSARGTGSGGRPRSSRR